MFSVIFRRNMRYVLHTKSLQLQNTDVHNIKFAKGKKICSERINKTASPCILDDRDRIPPNQNSNSTKTRNLKWKLSAKTKLLHSCQ